MSGLLGLVQIWMLSDFRRPLEGLKVYVTHIKEALVPHESGQPARTRILGELRALEKERQLGVIFVCVEPGDRICELVRIAAPCMIAD